MAEPAAVRSDVAHLYRRAGFGARPEDLDAAVRLGYRATVERLLDLRAPDPAADAVPIPSFTSARELTGGTAAARQTAARLRQEGTELVSWWLQRMVASGNPLREKLTLFWHGHFATAIQKVRLAGLMFRQNQLFRESGGGNFESLAQAVAKDPAMLLWLDSNTNRVGHANENFARELFELFTLGIGNYTETDIKQAARCFTGWTYNRQEDGFVFRPSLHDNGSKTVLGVTGDLDGESVIRVATHTGASASWIVSRLWSHFAYPVSPDDEVVRQLVPGYARDLDIGGVLRAMFLHPAFLSDQARTGLVKQPVEYVVGVLRAFRAKGDNPAIAQILYQLGQVPFNPPNVGGWPQNGYWLTTATALGRLRFAAAVAAKADLSSLGSAADLARFLGIDGWSPQTAAALARASSPREFVTLALTAPEYVLN